MKRVTCRHCHFPINYEYWPQSMGQAWVSTDGVPERKLITCQVPEDPDDWRKIRDMQKHEPAEVCPYRKGDGTMCLRPLKEEDVRVGLYACGIHLRMAIADKEQADALQRRREEDAAREEREAFEVRMYNEAAAYIRSVGLDIGNYQAKREYRSGVERKVQVDAHYLAEWIRKVRHEFGDDDDE